MDKQPSLGVSEEMIASAELELGIRFPDQLREAWKLYNCNEMSSGWPVFPIFDPANPRKTCGSVTYENLRGAWGKHVMEQGLVSISANGTGNQIVLKVVSGQAGDQAFHWHHETQKLSPWRPGLASILAAATKAREDVLRLQQRFSKRDSKSSKSTPQCDAP